MKSSRSFFSEMGPTLVINLKRFEYNFQTDRREKINDYCSFPELLDLTPWTKEGIDAAEKQADNKQDSEMASQNNDIISEGDTSMNEQNFDDEIMDNDFDE